MDRGPGYRSEATCERGGYVVMNGPHVNVWVCNFFI